MRSMPFFRRGRREKTSAETQRLLILTPVKNAEHTLPNYYRLIDRLTYPKHLISLGFLESDSTDGTVSMLKQLQPAMARNFRRVMMWNRDFGFQIPAGMDRHTDVIQVQRRSILARSRNHLLFHALDDEEWVLWIDVDLLEFPADIIETLLATGKQIVQPHCVLEYGGQTFDQNAWADHGRKHMDALRDRDLVELQSVGGTMLLVRADLHRDGLVFPSFLYGSENPLVRPGREGEIETEGFGLMARDMGVQCWGLPNLEIKHQPF